VKGYCRRGQEEGLEKGKEARTALGRAIERGEHFLAAKTADVEAAVKAGRETMKEKIDTCCS